MIWSEVDQIILLISFLISIGCMRAARKPGPYSALLDCVAIVFAILALLVLFHRGLDPENRSPLDHNAPSIYSESEQFFIG